MLINELIALLSDVPPVLAAQWAAWFSVGLILSIWTRREKARLVVHPPSPRRKSGVRPASGVRSPSGVRSAATSRSTAARASVSATGDAFGELEALLEPETGAHRRPGDAPHPSDDSSLATNRGSAGLTR